MKKALALFFALAVLFGQPLGAGARGAHRHHHFGPRHRVIVGVGPFWGPPWWWYPYPYPYPAGAYPPAIVLQEEPMVYIQRSEPPSVSYWYYCPDKKGYYPYVQECATTWLRVAPQPRPPRQ